MLNKLSALYLRLSEFLLLQYINEPYTQYVRHFIYMVKRNKRSGNKHNGYGDDSEFDLPISKKSKSKLVLTEPTLVEKKEKVEASISKKTSLKKSASKKKISRSSLKQ